MKQLVVALACTAGAFAAHAEAFLDNARVRSVEPQYENISVPREACRSEWVTETRRVGGGGPDYGGVVIGALAGGVLGNQVGKGHGREAATAVGAVVGALAGDRIASNNRYYERVQDVPRQVTRCQTVTEVESRLTGYRVVYDYRGQAYSTLMRDDPGPSLQVRVSIDPVVR